MKHLYFFACAIIMLISISCKKDSVNNVTHICNPCITDTSFEQHRKVIYITDSNWVGQGQRVFKSDLTQILKEAGATVSEVYALQLVNEGIEFQVFPCCPVNFHGGELSGSIYTTGDEKTCTLTFTYTDHDVHSGEQPNPGIAPFQSIVVKVWLWK
jgi:hypothetical protein